MDASSLRTPTQRAWDCIVAWSKGPSDYRLTAFVIVRALGFVYFVAFIALALQVDSLLGSGGLLPAHLFVDRVLEQYGGPGEAFWELPTLFLWGVSDTALVGWAWAGVALSGAMMLGLANVFSGLALWVLYGSFVRIGQAWYGFGWELQLLETGALALLLLPAFDPRPNLERQPPKISIWLFRWLIVRIMLGAGLIKLRGDDCWTDLTCLFSHYETQPNPHPLSWFLHQSPEWLHRLSVLWNHFVELVVPLFVFGPRPLRHIAGVFLVLFQGSLILSGNLSFLNWLTLIPALACFDDTLWKALWPRRFTPNALSASPRPPTRSRALVAWGYALLVAWLSWAPVGNLISDEQAMNQSFDPFALVNTYGAFGSVGDTRYELVIQGTTDETLGPETEWLEYELPCKPGRVDRAPCVITPYHLRLDWQIWFAAMSSYQRHPWMLHLVYKLLHNDEAALALVSHNPFEHEPPRHIRVRRYIYEFTDWDDDSGHWWKRELHGEWLPPLSREHAGLREIIRELGWPVEP